MNVSVLIRLLATSLAEGRVAGHAEIVDTGETAVFKDQDEMLAFIRRASTLAETPERGDKQDSGNMPDR